MSSKKKERERRVSRRVCITLPIIYSASSPSIKDELRIRALTKDISARGLGFVASNKPRYPSMNLQIELPPKHQKDKYIRFTSRAGSPPDFINAKVKIVYSKPISKLHKDIFRTGVCFIELAKNDAALLRNLLIPKKKAKKKAKKKTKGKKKR